MLTYVFGAAFSISAMPDKLAIFSAMVYGLVTLYKRVVKYALKSALLVISAAVIVFVSKILQRAQVLVSTPVVIVVGGVVMCLTQL